MLSGGAGGGPGVVLAGSLHAADGAWAADPYPLLEGGVESLDKVLWVAGFFVLFAVFWGEDAQELESGALCYFAVL